jgi:hypothetical protein
MYNIEVRDMGNLVRILIDTIAPRRPSGCGGG